jgi:retron-type reverse transcriptase
MLEKIVNQQLISYLENNKILSNNQFGFRTGRSTEDAVTLLTNIVSGQLDEGQKSIGLFLDLAKAFDTVSVPILLSKLEATGVRGLGLEWFRSYLTNRKQCVKLGTALSDAAGISFGVPQGSILTS